MISSLYCGYSLAHRKPKKEHLHFENVSWLLVLPFTSLETSFTHVGTQKHATTCNYHAVYFKRKAEKVKSKFLNEAFHWKPFACKNMKFPSFASTHKSTKFTVCEEFSCLKVSLSRHVTPLCKLMDL